MTQWYYAQNSQQRHGPLSAENLAELYRSGRIGLDTLVWRDGQAQWQPLADFAAELGLTASPGAPLPPPLPPAQSAFAANRAPVPPRSGLSGCMIALIVCAVLAIPMLGILAAIALPAYQDYTLRAKACRRAAAGRAAEDRGGRTLRRASNLSRQRRRRLRRARKLCRRQSRLGHGRRIRQRPVRDRADPGRHRQRTPGRQGAVAGIRTRRLHLAAAVPKSTIATCRRSAAAESGPSRRRRTRNI